MVCKVWVTGMPRIFGLSKESAVRFLSLSEILGMEIKITQNLESQNLTCKPSFLNSWKQARVTAKVMVDSHSRHPDSSHLLPPVSRPFILRSLASLRTLIIQAKRVGGESEWRSGAVYMRTGRNRSQDWSLLLGCTRHLDKIKKGIENVLRTQK